MSRYNIKGKKPEEVVERRVIVGEEAKMVTSRYHIIGKLARLVWDYIFSFIFTKDGFGIQTKDGYIIKCKDQ